MAMHQPDISERVETLEERADASDLRAYNVDESIFEIRRAIHDAPKWSKAADEVMRLAAKIDIALDKDRSLTSQEISQLARRVTEMKRQAEMDKRDMLARLEQVDGKADASGQQSRDTLTSVQIRAEKLAQEQQLALERQESVNRERIAKERADRLAVELAEEKAKAAREEERMHQLKKWAFTSTVAAVVIAAAGIIAFLAGRAIPVPAGAAPHAIGVPALER